MIFVSFQLLLLVYLVHEDKLENGAWNSYISSKMKRFQ